MPLARVAPSAADPSAEAAKLLRDAGARHPVNGEDQQCETPMSGKPAQNGQLTLGTRFASMRLRGLPELSEGASDADRSDRPSFGSWASFAETRGPAVQTLRQRKRSVVTETVRGRFFAEARPVPGTTYFPASSASTGVVIALYNEVGPELDRTIQSLARSGVPLNVVVVADGISKLSDSMRLYLAQKFQVEQSVLRSDDSKAWGLGAGNQTFVSDPVTLGDSGSTFSVLLKRFNHKKINTHEWFFRAHCPNSGCRYALTTDSGAVFRDGSMRKMIDFFVNNDNVMAVTGRQRVMTEHNQRVLGREAMGKPVEKDSLFERCMRLLQGFDFEIDHTGGKAASCVAGLLPCLHGPCAFFRFDVIQGRCLNEYFDDWGYAPPHSLHLIGANLQLAEDRIPSLLGVLYSGGMRSDSAFDAVFEFEAELSLKAFMTQRRRWINGTIAGECTEGHRCMRCDLWTRSNMQYMHMHSCTCTCSHSSALHVRAGCIYALSQTPAVIASKKHSVYFKVSNVLLLVLQTLSFFLMFLTPGFFGFLFASAVGMIAVQAFGDDAEAPFRFFTMISYGSLYVLFVYVHLKRTNSNDCVLQPTLTKIVIGYNALLAIAVITAVVLHFIIEGAWFLLAVYASVPGCPILTACIGGDFEGPLLRYDP